MTQNRRKIVIIGAGIAGLCAAVHARRCGYEVDLLEQHDRPGGLATSWHRGPYTFEGCLHWLLGSSPHDPMYSLWREVFDIDRLTFVYPDEWTRIESEHGDHLSIYSNVDKMEAELLRRAPQDAEEIRRFAAAVRGLSDCPMPDWSGSWHHRWTMLLHLLPYLPLLRNWTGVTTEEYGKRFSDPLLRSFFGQGELAQLSALTLIFTLAWVSKRNAGYPIGGSQAIMDLIRDNLIRLGVRLRLGARVERIMVERDTAIGVELDNAERIEADWVISAADGHATVYELLEGRYVNERIDRIYSTLTPFPSCLQVSLGVARDLSGQCGYVTRVLDEPLAVDSRTTLAQVAFRFFHFDPTFSPAGKTAVTCFLPTRDVDFWVQLRERDPTGYQTEKQRVADGIITILEKSVAGLRDAIEVVDISTPATVIRYTGNWQGSMEGWMLTPDTGFRPLRKTLPGLRHFLMIGQWTMPGGGLPSGLITARQAVQQLCRHDGTRFISSRRPVPRVETVRR